MTGSYVRMSPEQYPPCVVKDCVNRAYAARARRCDNHRSRCVAYGCEWDAPRRSGRANYESLCHAHAGRKRGRSKTPFDSPIKRNGGDYWHLNASGYLQRSVVIDRDTGRRKNILQHRVVMEQHLNRPLTEHETVHHLNGDRTDNRLDNLELWSKSQPYGQRVSDKIRHAKEILATYGDDPTVYESHLT